MTVDPIWTRLLNDSSYGLNALIEKAIQDTGSARAEDFQELLGEIEAADPMALETKTQFGRDFTKLLSDAQSIDPNQPTTENLELIENDLKPLASEIPGPVSDQYKVTMEEYTCQSLKNLIATSPLNALEIEGYLNALSDFAIPIQGASDMVQNIVSAFQAYQSNPTNGNYWHLQLMIDDYDQFLLINNNKTR